MVLKFRHFGAAGEAVRTGWGRLGMAFPGRPGRWATRRRRQDPSGRELVAGASALLPRSRELDVDAPGLERTAVAGAAAGRSAAVFHRAELCHVLCVGVRDAGADRAADGVRDADRCWSVGVVVASPGAQVLLRRPLVTRRPRCAAGPVGGAVAAARRCRGERGHRRHPVHADREEGVGGRVVPRRLREGPQAGRFRQQLGHLRDLGQPADAGSAGVPAGGRAAGPQGHRQRLPAVAGPRDGHRAGPGPARPPHPRGRRRRLRRCGTTKAARSGQLDHPAPQGRRPLRAGAAAYRPPRPARKKGTKLAKLADLARTATFTPTTAHRYGKTTTVHTATINCLWYSVFGAQPVTVVLVREAETSRGYDLALVTTQAHATAGQIVERYASRWAVEVAIQDAKQLA